MHQYGLGLATPGAAGVLVITDQLLFF